VVEPETNIVMLDLPASLDARSVVTAAARAGVLLNSWSPSRIRAVFHLDIDSAMPRRAAEIAASLLETPSG
jgi:hypothetical protein